MRTAYETSETTSNVPIYIIGVSKREEREKGPEKIFKEIVAENFPNMGE